MVKMFLCLCCSVFSSIFICSNLFAFEFMDSNWSYMRKPMGEDFIFCNDGMPKGARQRTRDGAAEWNYSKFRFTFGKDACLSSGSESIFNEINQINMGKLQESVQARTHIWAFTGEPDTLECDIQFNNKMINDLTWYTGTGTPASREIDWWTIAAHELGHCLGLNHDGSDNGEKPVMFKSTSPGEVRRELTRDDIGGRNFIYGEEADDVVCPLTISLLDSNNLEYISGLFYRFRDEIMANSVAGKRYINIFYNNALEAGLLLVRNPELKDKALLALNRLVPIIEALVNKMPVELHDADRDIINDVLNSFIAAAKPKLRVIIKRIQDDINNKDFLAKFEANG